MVLNFPPLPPYLHSLIINFSLFSEEIAHWKGQYENAMQLVEELQATVNDHSQRAEDLEQHLQDIMQQMQQEKEARLCTYFLPFFFFLCFLSFLFIYPFPSLYLPFPSLPFPLPSFLLFHSLLSNIPFTIFHDSLSFLVIKL